MHQQVTDKIPITEIRGLLIGGRIGGRYTCRPGYLIALVHDRTSGTPCDFDGAVRAILNDPLEKHRAVWAEQLLLLAWWARAAKSKKQSRYWQDFLILARELTAGRPLAEIPGRDG